MIFNAFLKTGAKQILNDIWLRSIVVEFCAAFKKPCDLVRRVILVSCWKDAAATESTKFPSCFNVYHYILILYGLSSTFFFLLLTHWLNIFI